MATKEKPRAAPSLYSKIDWKKAQEKPQARPGEAYLKLTQRFGAVFRSFGRGSMFSEEEQRTLDFLGWKLDAQDAYGIFKGIIAVSVVAGVFLSLIAYVNLGDPVMALVPGALVALAGVGAAYFYLRYPEQVADRERKMAVAYIPEIVNYIVMNMRLTPNLEKAIEFAANHGRGKIAEDLKKLVWDAQIGVYSSVEEGLDDLAYRWGEYNDDFKHALMLIRASVLEGDPVKREDMLEKAVNDVLEGTKEKMDVYARQLHQPTVMLYYFGILLPLMLAIVLPIASGIVKGLPITGLLPFVAIYNIGIPIGVYVMARGILGGRPPTYVAPNIPEGFPGLPKRGYVRLPNKSEVPVLPLAIAIFIALAAAGWYLDQAQVSGVMNNLAIMEKDTAIDALPHVTIPFTGFRIFQFTIFALLIGSAVFTSLYLIGEYYERKKVQDEIRGMEVEFKDAMYVLASRLGENRPMEDALKHAIEFLPKSAIANRIFRRILDNITQLGMTMDTAIFDSTYGAVRDVPSEIIRSGMRIMVDSVQLGVNVAAMSLINLAMQLRNSQKIDLMLRRLLEDVTTMLKTMGTFIAPVVLAVVTSLQRIIINSLVGSSATQASATTVDTSGLAGASSISGATNLGSLFSNIDPKSIVSPGEFTLIMGIYVIEIVILLTYFNAQVEDSNNELHTMMSIAYSLPVAIIIFSAVAYIASNFLSVAG